MKFTRYHLVKIITGEKKEALLLTLAAFLCACGYLYASGSTLRLGFPLDDAWIHQTYARNLAQTGQWAFIPGQISAGSTSPAWSALLALGHLAGVAPSPWTYLLGWVALAGVAITGNALARRWVGFYAATFPWVGIFLAGEWHLVWAADSGMETLPYALAILALFLYLQREQYSPFLAGLFCGLAAWLRPDGITLIGPVVFTLFFTSHGARRKLGKIGAVLAGLAIGLVPYLLFNQALGGGWWPNTFLAKQTEYAIYRQEAFLARFVRLLSLPWVGSGLLILPGFLFTIWKAWAGRRWLILGAILWWLGYTGIYAANLPVDYQHGRYLMPAMPVYFVLAATGTIELFQQLSRRSAWRLLRFGWGLAILFTWIAFLVLGGGTYAQDVAIIETEMVDTAHWVATHTSPAALVAAHDIGALGYFGNRELLDLAGLISPEVIPFIRDEQRLAGFLDQKGATYLVTFPGWYPQLVSRAVLVYRSKGQASLSNGGENMAVYRWLADDQ